MRKFQGGLPSGRYQSCEQSEVGLSVGFAQINRHRCHAWQQGFVKRRVERSQLVDDVRVSAAISFFCDGSVERS